MPNGRSSPAAIERFVELSPAGVKRQIPRADLGYQKITFTFVINYIFPVNLTDTIYKQTGGILMCTAIINRITFN